MTELAKSYAANLEDVAAKVIDDELIIIRLSDGTYYAMDGVGVYVWELLTSGHELQDLVEILAEWYATPAERIEREVRTLVQELLAERLIVPVTSADLGPPVDAPSERLTYQTPQLNIYRDMGNLLALDPPTPGIDELLLGDEKAG